MQRRDGGPVVHWSTDNIGILAAEALLRAAERGVRVRVIVDDLLIDAPDKSLLALALHPNIDIRIYNPHEMIADPEYKIGRPRQLFAGSTKRDVKPIEKREAQQPMPQR